MTLRSLSSLNPGRELKSGLWSALGAIKVTRTRMKKIRISLSSALSTVQDTNTIPFLFLAGVDVIPLKFQAATLRDSFVQYGLFYIQLNVISLSIIETMSVLRSCIIYPSP
jgi:hypothetical protein